MDATARAFYSSHPIVAQGNVIVKQISDERGKGVVTTVAAKSGDLLFTEFPVLSLQQADSRRYLRACEFCLRCIGSLRDQWLRLLRVRREDRQRRRQHRAEVKSRGQQEEEDDEEEADDEDDAAIDEKEDSLPYSLPDPLPLTSPSSSQPCFDLSRYELAPVPCSAGCDDEYCSVECRDKAWRQYHSLLCPQRSFTKQQQQAHTDGKEEKGERKTDTQPKEQQHPLLSLYRFADESNEIFRLVVKLIATVLSSSALSASTGGRAAPSSPSSPAPSSPLFPFSLYQSSVWWDQVHPPSSFSPNSASRFRETLRSLCTEASLLIAPLFPLQSASSHPLHPLLFSPLAIARLVSIFETNQLSLFAPSPLPTYLAFFHSLPPALQDSVRSAFPAPVFSHTNAISSLRVEGSGLFPIGCCLNHSCRPSCLLVKRDHEREEEGFVDLDSSMSVMCVRAVAVGEEVTLSYVDEGEGEDAMSWRERAEVLRDYGIVCSCERCEEEKEAEERGDTAGATASEEEELENQYEDDDNEDGDDNEDADEEDEDDA